jgi:hypothetical protein
LWQSRATRGHLLRGRVVICGRWLLGSYVHMRYACGEERSYRWALTLIRAFSRRCGDARHVATRYVWHAWQYR